MDQFEEAKEAKEANQNWKYNNERTSDSCGKLKLLNGYGIKNTKDRVESWERRCNNSTCSFWLACLFLSNLTWFSRTYQLKGFRRKSSCHFPWRNGSIAAWMFVHPTNMAVILDFFSYQSKIFYQHQNVTIIIKGESETCPIFEIAIIILSLKFIGSFEAAVFSFTNLFFLPSHFSLLSSGRSLCCLPHFASTALRKKTSSQKSLSALSAMRNTRIDWRLRA